MSGEFSTIFVEACRRKGLESSADVQLSSAGQLVSVSDKLASMAFTDRGVSFASASGKGSYSWEELDFILPQDVTLASDKLSTFSEMEAPARMLAERLSRIFLTVLGLLLALWVFHGIQGFLAPAFHWTHTLPQFLQGIARLFLIGVLVIPVLVGTAFGAAVTGGFFAAIRGVLASTIQPFTLKHFKARYEGFQNGLRIMDASWVRTPGGLATGEVLDLVLLGVKLRRRGFV